MNEQITLRGVKSKGIEYSEFSLSTYPNFEEGVKVDLHISYLNGNRGVVCVREITQDLRRDETYTLISATNGKAVVTTFGSAWIKESGRYKSSNNDLVSRYAGEMNDEFSGLVNSIFDQVHFIHNNRNSHMDLSCAIRSHLERIKGKETTKVNLEEVANLYREN